MRRVLANLHDPTIRTTQTVDQITALIATTTTTTVTVRAAVTTTVITVTIIRILKYR